ncbi:hypothetical protein GCM10023063_18370 [Arthrobacter methylotrophus]|uniref:Uncharacterized protein n=1 Tax=Arthrobacter methylotrophus TaxID=121291 RepID=A0ABV5UP00_9MICC
MTTADRQPKGIPAGGQFAPSAHGEPEMSLTTPARRPELDGWPEDLPEPELGFHVTDEGQILSSATLPNGDFIEVWEKSNGSDGYDGHTFGEWDGADDENLEQAEQWLTGRHIGIVAAVRAEEKAAVERARARIMANATGIASAATDEELASTIEHNGSAARQALRDVELASAGLAARKILADHPTADTAEITTDSWDNGEFVSGAIVRDSGYNRLTEYFEDDDNSNGAKEVVGLLKNLDAEPHNSHWAGAFSTGSYGENLYTIDLKKAAAWTPAGEGAASAATSTVEPAPATQSEERPCTDGPWCTAPRGKHIDGCNMESF